MLRSVSYTVNVLCIVSKTQCCVLVNTKLILNRNFCQPYELSWVCFPIVSVCHGRMRRHYFFFVFMKMGVKIWIHFFSRNIFVIWWILSFFFCFFSTILKLFKSLQTFAPCNGRPRKNITLIWHKCWKCRNRDVKKEKPNSIWAKLFHLNPLPICARI